jgi:hypothetical protein
MERGCRGLLSRHLPEGAEKNHEESQDSQCPAEIRILRIQSEELLIESTFWVSIYLSAYVVE